MKNNKKLFSLLLALFMLISGLSTTIISYAGGWLDYVQNINFDTTYEVSASKTDYTTGRDHSFLGDSFYDAYRFYVPSNGQVELDFKSSCKKYFTHTSYYLYSENDITNEIAYIDFGNGKFNSGTGEYYDTSKNTLNKGTYILLAKYQGDIVWNDYFDDVCYLTVNLKISISAPSSFKVSTRNSNSLKLFWGKVGNVSGYQLQRKSGDTYKTITNTTATSYTVKDLASATNYSFRVRAYKTVEGKKYYSSWKTLTTPTKPSKVSIKTPTTNSKHQIIAKWNKVTRASGYQVQYCKNKSCSNVISTKTVSGQSKVSYTGKSFTKNKTYYVRVRAYKTVNSTKYYGAWSSVKSIKCK